MHVSRTLSRGTEHVQTFHQHGTGDLHGLSRRTGMYCVDLQYTMIGTDFAVALTARGSIHSEGHTQVQTRRTPLQGLRQATPHLRHHQPCWQLIAVPPSRLVLQQSDLCRTLDAQLEHFSD